MSPADDIGADDYITKPFSLMVLVSKVHAFMKRVETAKTSAFICGNIRVSLPGNESLEKRGTFVPQ